MPAKKAKPKLNCTKASVDTLVMTARAYVASLRREIDLIEKLLAMKDAWNDKAVDDLREHLIIRFLQEEYKPGIALERTKDAPRSGLREQRAHRR